MIVLNMTEFRETELGALPAEWKVATIGELFAIQQGASLSPKRRKGDSPRPFLRTANVFWSYLDLSKVDSMDFTDTEVEKLALRPHDLLVCEGGDIGRTAIWRGEIENCCYQNHLHRLRARDSNIESEFYVYWMQAAFTLLDLYKGEGNKTTIPNLSQSRLKSFAVPFPPLSEQRAIARVLSTIQRAMETQDKLISAARELKKSLMRQLFTHGLDANGAVKETEIGVMPEHWELVTIGDAVKATQYGISVRGQANGQYPILRMNNLAGGRLNVSDLQYVNLDDKEFRKAKLSSRDILFNRTNSFELVGKTSLFDLDSDYVFASYLVRIKVDESKLSPCLLAQYLNWDVAQSRLKSLATRGVSQSNISASKLRGFWIPLPPLSEQREIARILATVDKKIETEEKRQAALEALFKTMLQQLMTGQIRVVDSVV